ncbi:hypothetical protein CEXT_113731 [Caerostris extrusa]|uniref:Uncharacterized protein n=1 Tax=Caerostris extrusa TaxID=172846 RepID=A0AAV4QXW3_CAEEX|nr:hypothetical protein CEXT_113731 [Caerostris extrusa]
MVLENKVALHSEGGCVIMRLHPRKRGAEDARKGKIGLEINESNTEYMIMSPNKSKRRPRNVDIGGKTFEGVSRFKYLRTILSNDNSIHREVCERVQAGN